MRALNPRHFAAPAKAPAKIKNQRWPSFFKSLLIPVIVVVLFGFAPHWLNSKLRAQIVTAIGNSSELTQEQKNERIDYFEHIDLSAVALKSSPETLDLKERLVRAGVVSTYQFLHWGFEASVGLLILQLIAMGIMVILNSQAQTSQAMLIQNYRFGWQLGMAAALIQIVLLVPLLTYASYEFPIIWSDHWYPKIIIVILILGLTVIARAGKILLAKIPLQFNEPMSRRITPEQAPEMWEAVRAAAARLQTAPPDNIVVGLQLNFYVTELAVFDGKELAKGRTLYLSYPLLKQLPEDEVLAIIGHELGHFIGEDTVMTREFYPLRLKTHGTLVALHQATYVGWTAFHFLNFFDWSFGETHRRVSRERELQADAKAAALTSPQTAASALVRFHVLLEAFKHGMVDAVTKGGQSPLDVPLHTVVREKLPAGVAFWNELFEKKLPHPLDTHPALHVRLESLGQTIDAKAAEALAVQETESAYNRWFANRPEVFTDLRKEADDAMQKMRSRSQVGTADYQTDEGRQLLLAHFPEKKWRYANRNVWGTVVALTFCALGLAAAAIFIQGNGLATFRVTFALVTFFPVYGIVLAWKRHRDGELTLTAEGLNYTGWHRPLRFTDVAKISFIKNYSALTLTFHLKEPQPPFWKLTLFGGNRRRLKYTVSGLVGNKPADIAQIIFRYYTRQVPQ